MQNANTSSAPMGLRSSGNSSSSVNLQESFEMELEDTNWILTSAFIIFTMQTGFGMLESGCVSIKNEANIMMKNLVDISLGGLTYWIFGYGMSFGQGPYSNAFIGLGDFLIDPPVGDSLMGPVFASFLFQLSFATTATTIVSGAMAERCNFKAYCLFSFLNTVVYCVPAGWVWGSKGFLNQLGAVDIAGSGPVHLIGGSSAFASALMLGPRLGRYAHGTAPLPLGNPVNVVMGTFVLWWGWLAFNSGSTYGVSGAKWQYAARAAVMTMMGSFGGGCFGLVFTLIKNKGRADVLELINSILGSLVSITAGCFLYRAWEALLIGTIGGAIASAATPLFDKMRIDDPVGASAVHGACGIWGVIAVGLFADNPVPLDTTNGRSGLFKGGGWYLLGVQMLTVVCLMTWAILVTVALLWAIDLAMPIRMDPYEELLGADLTEHRIRHGQVGVSRAVSVLRPYRRTDSVEHLGNIGVNTGHNLIVDSLLEASLKNKIKPASSKLQTFTNQAFVNDKDHRPSFTLQNGFLNKRPGNPQNELHRNIDSVVHDMNTGKFRVPKLSANFKKRMSIESVKGRKLNELSVEELDGVNEMNANDDRFRHRFNDEDYASDIPSLPSGLHVQSIPAVNCDIVGVSRAVSVLRPYRRTDSVEHLGNIGVNTGHNLIVDSLLEASLKNKIKPASSKLQTFTNQAFVNDKDHRPSFTLQNGFLNKRPGNPQNELHRNIDSVVHDMNTGKFRVPKLSANFKKRMSIESVKGRKLNELSVEELDGVNEMNANDDRFRHRFNDEDYASDVRRASLAWVN